MRINVCIFHYQTAYTEPDLGITRITNKLKSFDLEFRPFIDEMNAKQGVIRECADAATMERVRGKCKFYIFVLDGYQQAANAAEFAGYLAADWQCKQEFLFIYPRMLVT